MRQTQWSRYAAFVAVGILVGFIVDRYAVGSRTEPTPRPIVVAATAPTEAPPPTPLVTTEPEPVVVVEPEPPSIKPKARIVAARRTVAPVPSVVTGPVLDLRR